MCCLRDSCGNCLDSLEWMSIYQQKIKGGENSTAYLCEKKLLTSCDLISLSLLCSCILFHVYFQVFDKRTRLHVHLQKLPLLVLAILFWPTIITSFTVTNHFPRLKLSFFFKMQNPFENYENKIGKPSFSKSANVCAKCKNIL